jgi:hypothetical protein
MEKEQLVSNGQGDETLKIESLKEFKSILEETVKIFNIKKP